MEFEHVAIGLLASVVLVLVGIVAWIYWQQTRLFQNFNLLAAAVGELAVGPPSLPVETPEPPPETPSEEPAATPAAATEDDRLSVEVSEDTPAPATAVVEGPPDNDDLSSKTVLQLRELLTQKGLPWTKKDNKGALISLLKATS